MRAILLIEKGKSSNRAKFFAMADARLLA